VLVIPAIDIANGRSRVVFWPGVATGTGTPTDRPERIAEHFVGLGAPLIHLVDFDGARAARPVNLEAVGAIASRVATPLQLAGGVEDADAIRLAFAAGATRIVTSMALADDPEGLAASLAVAGDWLAVGVDPRPERLAQFRWRGRPPFDVVELVERLLGSGVRRVVVGHASGDDARDLLARLVALTASADADVLVAGGGSGVDDIRRLRDSGVAGIILGEALLSGAIDYPTAREAAA
jgi:phosphoribosylformimino-5-aminoimidazole carboxamide ribotide isomerase